MNSLSSLTLITQLTTTPDPETVAAAAVAQVTFRRPWSIEAAIATLSLERNRPITLHDLPPALSEHCSAVWVPTANSDKVFVRTDLTDVPREIAIGHELGHILLQHTLSAEERESYLASLFPLMPPQIVANIFALPCSLARSNYEHPFELQAEWFARLLVARADEYRDTIIPANANHAQRRMLDQAARTFGWP